VDTSRADERNDQPAPIFSLEDATVTRPGGEVVFRDLNWIIREGETWAIIGPTGSGKTALTEVLSGRFHLRSGTLGWPLVERLRSAGRSIAWPSEVMGCVSFKEDSWRFSYARHYYQQRFNFIEPHDDLTLDDFLRTGVSATEETVVATTRRLEIDAFRTLSLIKLSNGQMRRARIARALLSRPELLILDDPFMGLDVAGRGEVSTLLGHLVREGIRVLLITRPGAIPAWVTHVLELDQSRIRRQGPVSKRQAERSGLGYSAIPHSPFPIPPSEAPVIELKNVNVVHAGRAILWDISWTVRAGERWAVVGPNGSGKTTLLSLIAGDHPQAYSNDIQLFGRQRGTGESIWDIKRRLGLVSPEFHLYFSEPLRAADAAATGFFDTLVRRPTTAEQDAAVNELFAHFGIIPLAGRAFSQLSTGEQRLVLLIRALVKRPPVLILDEPFQGLDRGMMDRAKDWLNSRLGSEQTLIFVTHYAEEIPRSVTRFLRLENGKIAEVK
jgi:molybdate transport system ATP-binding protein